MNKKKFYEVGNATNSTVAAKVYMALEDIIKKSGKNGKDGMVVTGEEIVAHDKALEGMTAEAARRGLKILVEHGYVNKKRAGTNRVTLTNKQTKEKKTYCSMREASIAINKNPMYIQGFYKRGKNETPEYYIKHEKGKIRGKVYCYSIVK